MQHLKKKLQRSEISGSHSSKYEDDCLLGCCTDHGGSEHLWNIGQFLWDYMVQDPRRQSFKCTHTHKTEQSKTEPISTVSVVQLTMITEGAHAWGNLFVRKCAEWSHRQHITHTHTSTICIPYKALLSAYYKAENIYYLFLFLVLDTYYIPFYAISLSLFIQFFAPLPNFATLGYRLVCLVVKVTVC
jgi:hypothetical protein